MYGFVVEGVFHSIKQSFGDAVYGEIVTKGKFRSSYLNTKKYSETIIPHIVKVASEVTGKPESMLLEACGLTFATYIFTYGYDRLLRVLGRHYRDFIQALDNIHDYMRFTFPRIAPPSFFCEEESRHSMVLHYRSRRKGYLHYVIGQLKSIGQDFYETEVSVTILSNVESLQQTHVVMRLDFDNCSYVDDQQGHDPRLSNMNLPHEILADVFPFHLVFDYNFHIRAMGNGILNVIPRSFGQSVDEIFTMTKPLVEFTMENIFAFANNVFELVTANCVRRVMDIHNNTFTETLDESDEDVAKGKRLKLKGQMINMEEWQCILFLGTPMLDNLSAMFDMGLFINDLSIHDSSRDLVLASTQQQTELKRALALEKEKNNVLQETMLNVDREMRRTDALLYQMIPKAVAVRLRNGEPAINTCQVFDKVTILFTDVVGFTSICSELTPMGVVELLNNMYTRFDNLAIKHRVYKVETIGDAYMVASGAPIVTTFHAIYICDMGFGMIDAMRLMEDPSLGPNSHMKIRVGIHTGPVVGGVVGVKMPRYCLIGESVSTANKMESSGSPMKIHISATTQLELHNYPYIIQDADPLEVKGRGMMKTFWLTGKSKDASFKGPVSGVLDEDVDEMRGRNNTATITRRDTAIFK